MAADSTSSSTRTEDPGVSPIGSFEREDRAADMIVSSISSIACWSRRTTSVGDARRGALRFIPVTGVDHRVVQVTTDPFCR
jgi:hypothetical protein